MINLLRFVLLFQRKQKHDIAVMRLDSPITDVKPVMIPFFWDYWQPYEDQGHFDIVGWGRTHWMGRKIFHFFIFPIFRK